MKELPRKIFLEHLGSKHLKMSAMSEAMGISTAGLWYYVHERRRFPADNWLKALKALGALEFGDGQIIIKTKHAALAANKMISIQDKGYFD